jgi:fumarylacetoacetate (FAA) hydrolase
VAVVTGDVPMGATPAQCAQAIRLLMLVNDVSLRNLIPGELAKGFGFLQSKPASGLLAGGGDARRTRRRLAATAKVHLPLEVD